MLNQDKESTDKRRISDQTVKSRNLNVNAMIPQKKISKFSKVNKNQPSQRTQNTQPKIYNTGGSKINSNKNTLKSERSLTSRTSRSSGLKETMKKTTKIEKSNFNKEGHIISANEKDPKDDLIPYNDMINQFKHLLEVGSSHPKYFLKKEILNCDEEILKIEKFNLDKILRLNAFCEEVETMGVTFQNFRDMTKQNFSKLEERKQLSDRENYNEVLNTNVIRMASERRINVYENLFENIKNTFDDVIKLTEMKPIFQPEKKNSKLNNEEEIINSRKLLNFNYNNLINTRKDDKQDIINNFMKKTKTQYVKILEDSSIDSINSLIDDSQESIIEEDEDSLNEGVATKIIPTSKIRNVNLIGKEVSFVPFYRRDTLKDILVYDRKARRKIKTILDKQKSLKSQSSKLSFKSNRDKKKIGNITTDSTKKDSSGHFRFESLARY
jgi:hypothetical protein